MHISQPQQTGHEDAPQSPLASQELQTSPPLHDSSARNYMTSRRALFCLELDVSPVRLKFTNHQPSSFPDNEDKDDNKEEDY
jgi:hypothetical protein